MAGGHILKQHIQELNKIEQIMRVTYGKHGRTALIQSTANNSFMATNDGNTVLLSLSFFSSPVLKLVQNAINANSNSNGDCCKTLFFFVYDSLSCLTSQQLEGSNEVVAFLTKTSAASFYKTFMDEWRFNEATRSIQNANQFLDVLPQMAVLHDLTSSNEYFSDICIQLATCFIQHLLLVKNHDLLDQQFHQMLNDLQHVLVYSDKLDLGNSKVFTNGFLIDRRFVLNNLSRHGEKQIKAVLIQKSNETFNHKSNTFVTIESQQNLLKFCESSDEISFSSEFLNLLTLNKVNLVFSAESISEVKKAQLNAIDCSLVSFIEPEVIQFIGDRIGVLPISSRSSHDDVKANILHLESMEQVQNETCFFYRLASVHAQVQLAYIHFCSPVKLFYQQFKSYLTKILRTFRCLFDKDDQTSSMISECGLFESRVEKIFEKLENKSRLSEERLAFRYFKILFNSLDLKLNKNLSTGNRRSLLMRTILLGNENKQPIRYEPISLKLKCLIQWFSIIQQIIKIDRICCVKKSLKNNKKGGSSDDESD